ncbi:TlpA family protein disulfide reductase [Longitalea arenae]|uniref:TlpA family protein disulfide reductase n=1 Tax=Longitalea arenae TaxID=2812558 RepID=UPI00196816B2|nr:thioredoxin fold domain-containing protein [Longitalea arenae]
MKYIILIFIIACLAGCFGAEPQKTGKEGQPMPEFSLLLTDSLTVLNTGNISTGKPVVLFYFSPYCPYCKVLTEEIIEEIDELKNIQFYFVSIYPISDLKLYYNYFKLAKFPNITIGQDIAQFVSTYFQMPGVPYTAIYGKDKKLNNAFIGKLSANQLKRVAEQ